MQKLDEFGKKIVSVVRDETTDTYLMIRSGKMKSEEAQNLFSLIDILGEDYKIILDKVVADIIDRTIHNFLWALERSDDFTITHKETVADSEDLIEMSDGLTGELYGENGWYAKFSKNLLNRADI